MKQLLRSKSLSFGQIENKHLFVLSSILIIAAILLGGGPNVPGINLAIIHVMSALVVAACLFSGAGSKIASLTLFQKLFLLLVLLTPLIQLIPLPPSIWHQLPGRGTELEILTLIGAENRWRPLSIEPVETLFATSAMFPALAIFLAATCLGHNDRRALVYLVAGLVLASIFVGVFQFGTRGAVLNFYGSSHSKFLLGFFANRNHQGLFIAIGLVFSLSLLATNRRRSAIAFFSAAVLSIVFVAGTASRAGMGLVLVALLIVSPLFFNASDRKYQLSLAGVAIAGAIAAFLLYKNDVVSSLIERFNLVSEDDRWQFWQTSSVYVQDYLPFGSGLGSFVSVNTKNELLENVSTSYLNHVHNDYIELALEAGLMGFVLPLVLLILIVGKLVAFLPSNGKSAMKRNALGLAGLSVVFLVMLHSVVDYPLRTQAIAVVFGLALALMFHKLTDNMATDG